MDEPQPGTSTSGQKRRNQLPNELCSPLKKRAKTSSLNSYEKTIIINLYKFLVMNMATYPYKEEIVKHISSIVSVSLTTVRKVLNEYKTKGQVKSPEPVPSRKAKLNQLDDFVLTAIRRKVHQFYFKNELPTIDKVLEAVNDDEDLPSFSRSSMYKLMKKMNFKYTKRSRRSILLERPDLIDWRRNYLLRMKDFRKENRKIYYTDETWVNEGHTANYVWIDDDIKSSRQVFLNGLSTGLNVFDVEKMVKDGFSGIGPESWRKCIEHVKKKEDEMMKLDGIIDEMTDGPTPQFIIHVGESDSDSDSDSEDE